MPELPDVEIFKEILDQSILNKTINEVRVFDSDILKNLSVKRLSKNLVDKKITKTERTGKYLFAKTNKDKWMIFHFGMSGSLRTIKEDDKEKFDKVFFVYGREKILSYTSVRKLGSIELNEDREKYLKRNEIGIDFFDDDLTVEKFIKKISDKKGSIKSALMDQSLTSGIGNVYADEILFQVGIHPKAKISKLSESEIKKIFKEGRKTLETAIKKKADRKKFPRNYLSKTREENSKCPKCKGKIKKIKVSGRPTYFCSKHQNKGEK